LSLDICTPERVQAGGPYLAVPNLILPCPTLSCRANDFLERLLYNGAKLRRNFARLGFYTAKISYGHDIAALKS
jgi:hypothetical protein